MARRKTSRRPRRRNPRTLSASNLVSSGLAPEFVQSGSLLSQVEAPGFQTFDTGQRYVPEFETSLDTSSGGKSIEEPSWEPSYYQEPAPTQQIQESTRFRGGGGGSARQVGGSTYSVTGKEMKQLIDPQLWRLADGGDRWAMHELQRRGPKHWRPARPNPGTAWSATRHKKGRAGKMPQWIVAGDPKGAGELRYIVTAKTAKAAIGQVEEELRIEDMWEARRFRPRSNPAEYGSLKRSRAARKTTPLSEATLKRIRKKALDASNTATSVDRLEKRVMAWAKKEFPGVRKTTLANAVSDAVESLWRMNPRGQRDMTMLIGEDGNEFAQWDQERRGIYHRNLTRHGRANPGGMSPKVHREMTSPAAERRLIYLEGDEDEEEETPRRRKTRRIPKTKRRRDSYSAAEDQDAKDFFFKRNPDPRYEYQQLKAHQGKLKAYVKVHPRDRAAKQALKRLHTDLEVLQGQMLMSRASLNPSLASYVGGGRGLTMRDLAQDRHHGSGSRGGYTQDERDDLPDSEFLKPGVRGWPVSDETHAKEAIKYMVRGFGNTSEYPTLIMRLSQHWPVNKANKSIWALYTRSRSKIESKCGCSMPSLKDMARYNTGGWR